MPKARGDKYPSKPNTRLIPKSVFKKFIKAVRLYFNYSQDVISLPRLFYYTNLTLLIISSSLPLLLTLSQDTWESGLQFSNMTKFLSFFWRFGAVWVSYYSVLIGNCIVIGLYIVLLVPNFVFSLIYYFHGRIPHACCFFTCLSNEFMLPTIVVWMPSQLGAIFHLFLLDLSFNQRVLMIAFFVVIFLLLLFQLIYSHCFIFPQLNFQIGRTVLWLGSSLTIMYSFMCIQLFLTEAIEIITNVPLRSVFIGLETLVAVGYICVGLFRNPTVNSTNSTIFVGLLESTFLIYIFNVLQIYGIKFDINIIILLFISSMFLGILSSYIYVKYMEVKSMALYDSLMNGTMSFDEAFKSPVKFLHHSRNAFKNGHPFLFTWKTFMWAIEKYPKYSLIWMQFLRYLAIYYEDMNILLEYLNHYSKMPKKSTQVKTFLFFVRKCANSRNRHFNKDLSDRFRALDARISQSNAIMISYWSAIENDAPSLAYALCKTLSDNFADIESNFNQLILLYPNNAHICNKFASFLINYSNDPKRAEFYKQKAIGLSEQETYTIDITAQSAFEMFPLIPRSLEEIHRMAEHDIVRMHSSEGSQSQSRSLSLRSTGSTTTRVLDDDDFEDTTASRIRELGRTTPVLFIRNLMITSLLFFVITYVGGSFSPPFIVLSYLKKFNTKFNAVSIICEIVYLVNKIPNYLMAESMTISGTWPTKEDEQFILTNSTSLPPSYIPNSQLINQASVRLNELIHTFTRMFGDNIQAYSDIGNYLARTKIKLVSHTLAGDVYYTDSITEALTSICGGFLSYSSSLSMEGTEFMSQKWFTDVISNSRTVGSALMILSSMICKDVVDLLKTFRIIIIVIIILFGLICIIFLPIILYNIDKISASWGIIMHSIKSLPRISIQDVISRITKLVNINNNNEDKPFRTYDKYTNMFIQMGSSKDVANIIDINKHYALAVFNFILALIALAVVGVLVLVESNNLTILPYRICLSSNLNAVTSLAITGILRRVTFDNRKPFWMDNRTFLFAQMTILANYYDQLLNSFMFGRFDNQLAGVISSSKGLINQLSYDGHDWLHQTIVHDRLIAMPSMMSINLMYQHFLTIVEKMSRLGFNFPMNDTDVLLFVHTINDHLDEDVFRKEIDLTFKSMAASTTKSLNVTIFSISVAMLCIGICMCTFIAVNLNGIRVTTQFCLSNLSLIEPHFLKENNKIMNLFSGDFTNTTNDNNFIGNSYQTAEEKMLDAVIVIDEVGNIVDFNRTAKELFKFDEQIVVQMPLEKIFDFGCSISFHEDEDVNIDTTIKIINFDQIMPMNVSVVCVPEKREKVIFFRSLETNEKKLNEIREIQDQINALKYRVMPNEILDRVNSSMQMTVHNIFTVVIDMCDYTEFSVDKSADVLRTRFRSFFDVVEKELPLTKDALKLRNLGVASFIVFNLVRDSSNTYEVAKDAFDFCKRVAKTFHEAGISFKIGIAHDKTAKAGMISDDRLLFDVYSRGMQMAYSLARKAAPSTLIACNKATEFIPATETEKSQQVQLSIMGNSVSLFHQFQL